MTQKELLDFAVRAVDKCLHDSATSEEGKRKLAEVKEWLLGWVFPRERLQKLNEEISEALKTAAKKENDADLADYNYKIALGEAVLRYRDGGETAISEAELKARKDPIVRAAFELKLKTQLEYKDTKVLAETLTRRWNDLHAQNKAAYGYEIREAVS